MHTLFAYRNLIHKFYPSLWSLFKGKEYYDLDTLDWFSVTHSCQIPQPNLWNRTIPFAKIILIVGYLVLCLCNELPTMSNKPQVGHKYLPNIFAQETCALRSHCMLIPSKADRISSKPTLQNLIWDLNSIIFYSQ